MARETPKTPQQIREEREAALRVLGLTANASFPEIRSRYLKLVKENHADYHPNDKSKEEKLKMVNTAYDILEKQKDLKIAQDQPRTTPSGYRHSRPPQGPQQTGPSAEDIEEERKMNEARTEFQKAQEYFAASQKVDEEIKKCEDILNVRPIIYFKAQNLINKLKVIADKYKEYESRNPRAYKISDKLSQMISDTASVLKSRYHSIRADETTPITEKIDELEKIIQLGLAMEDTGYMLAITRTFIRSMLERLNDYRLNLMYKANFDKEPLYKRVGLKLVGKGPKVDF